MAPKKLEFFDRDWKYIGSKEKLVEDISNAANISCEHLNNFRTASLAQKMSWLANRRTKYLEDLSYCMLGILSVGNLEGLYMEPRYSQGTSEFQRLQQEMIKKWNPFIPFDESMFAWKDDRIATSGLLAPAPSCFAKCGNVVFDPGLAKLRLLPSLDLYPQTGKNNGISSDEANNMNFVTQWIFPVPGPLSGILCLGTFGFLPVVPIWLVAGWQALVRHREITLNCWVRQRDGQLRVQKIKMEKRTDGTWQRIDCGNVFTSPWKRIYPTRYFAASYPAPLRITNSPVQEKSTLR